MYYSHTQEAGGVEPWEALLGYWPDAGMITQLDGTYRYALVKKTMLYGANNYASVKYCYTADKTSVEGARIFGLAARRSGGEWKVIRQISKMTATLGQGILVGMLPEEMKGQKDVQISVFYTTPKDNTKYFLYMDDIEFFGYMDNAYGVDFSWKGGMPYTSNGQLAVDLSIMNTGNVMESCEISYTLNGGAVQTIPLTFADSLFPGQSCVQKNFVPQGWDATAYGKHTLEFWLSKVNGTDIANVTKKVKYLTNINPATTQAYQYHPLVEHFSASTCAYCAPLNAQMNPVYEALGDTITLIKYPTSFPNSGDPYVTDESDNRSFYYNIGGVPAVVLDGHLLYLSGTYESIAAYLKDTMLSAANKKVYFDMWFDTLAVDVDENIHINLKVKAVGGAENVTLQAVVVEGTTYGNASTNGETEFHNVMMKMLPYSNGQKVNLLPDTVYTFDYVYDMMQTHMEEFTDLKVACFLQTESGEVLQSVIGKAGARDAGAGATVQVDYVPTYICAGEVPVGLRLSSTGATTLESVEIEAKVGAATPVVRTYPVSLAWGESAYVVLDGLAATAQGADTISFKVRMVNGDMVDGQTARHPIYVQPTQYAFLPLLEDFTSANNAGSAVLNQYVDAFGDDVCLAKFPMKGDSYTRTVYTGYAAKLGVFGAPGLALNGCNIKVAADGKLMDEDYFESLLEQTRRNPSIMKVDLMGNVEIGGNSINPEVKATFNFASSVDISCLLYALMVETVTEENAGSNGEKPIKRVVQALFPDENGATVNIRNGTGRFILNQSVLNPPVENFNNLKLVLFIKDEKNKEVLQTAEFPIMNKGVANEGVAAYETLDVYPNPASEYVYLKALENALLEVFDMNGHKVFGLSGVSGDYTLDVRGYVPGAYIVKVSEGAKVSTARISVVR